MRVIIADPNEVYRAGVRSVLADRADAEVVGEVGDEAGLIDLIATTDADLVFVDPEIANRSDVDVVGRVRRAAPDLKVVVVVVAAHNGSVRKIIRLGADACVLKGAAPQELVAAARLAVDGRHYIQAELVDALVSEGPQTNELAGTLPALHVDMLEMVARGLRNDEVAAKFGISPTALKSHLRLIYAHLDVSSRVEAVASALRQGIIA